MRINRKFIAVSIALFLGCVGASILIVRSAAAHAEVAQSNPAEGAAAPSGLRDITITFTEDVSIDQSSAQVIGPAGETLAGTSSAVDRADRRKLRITTPPLTTGAYMVKWRVVTEDDNAITNGEVHFSVTDQAPTNNATSLVPIILLLLAVLLLAATLYLVARRRSAK